MKIQPTFSWKTSGHISCSIVDDQEWIVDGDSFPLEGKPEFPPQECDGIEIICYSVRRLDTNAGQEMIQSLKQTTNWSVFEFLGEGFLLFHQKRNPDLSIADQATHLMRQIVNSIMIKDPDNWKVTSVVFLS